MVKDTRRHVYGKMLRWQAEGVVSKPAKQPLPGRQENHKAGAGSKRNLCIVPATCRQAGKGRQGKAAGML